MKFGKKCIAYSTLAINMSSLIYTLVYLKCNLNNEINTDHVIILYIYSIKKKDIYQKVSLYKGNTNKRLPCAKHPGIDFSLWKESKLN